MEDNKGDLRQVNIVIEGKLKSPIGDFTEVEVESEEASETEVDISKLLNLMAKLKGRVNFDFT